MPPIFLHQKQRTTMSTTESQEKTDVQSVIFEAYVGAKAAITVAMQKGNTDLDELLEALQVILVLELYLKKHNLISEAAAKVKRILST